MEKERILVVDDEEDILEVVRYNLMREGYRPSTATTGEKALESVRFKLPDLVVLDLMLPGLDGLQVCRALKADPRTAHIPVIMLTAKTDEADVVTGLEVGADDYVSKPFSPKILIARIRTVLRRIKEEVKDEKAVIQTGDLVITPGRHEVLYRGKPVILTVTEFRLLHFLARRPGWVFSREQIVDGVKGEDYAATDRSVDVQVMGLRKKLGAAAEHIDTVRGVGYRFLE